MQSVFSTTDWLVILGYLALTVGIGLSFRKRAETGLAGFFLGGRNLPWAVAGLSMVATTFAADTPLWVTEKIAQHGISGNWLWWNMLIGGLLTTFFFARYWRRAEILTELEFLELRYDGPAARLLRGVKSVYLGLFLNAIVIGWVNAAMIDILEVFFGLDYYQAFWLVVLLMILTALYSMVSGLLGIAITDTLQFTLAMTGCVILAWMALDLPEIGGMEGLKQKLPAWRFRLLPEIGSEGQPIGTFTLSLGAFFSYVALQWWASWYPGNEPGGGGYISQRMMSVRNENGAVYSSLFFQLAHYCLRPWPWIIVGLCALVLYPDLPLEESGKGFVYVMRDHLPSGLKGLLFVAFLSAYMSTISTQLNWGASYLTNDLYRRFISPAQTERQYVRVARLFTFFIMLVGAGVSSMITTIDAAAQFLIASGAGLGMVLILRWYWWRINAWSELTATLAPLLALGICKGWIEPNANPNWGLHNGTFYVTVGFTTLAWLTVTYLTSPTRRNTLEAFYARVRPAGWWRPVREQAGLASNNAPVGWLFASWFSAVIMAYGLLFAIGYWVMMEYADARWATGIALASFLVLRLSMRKSQSL